jgi:three-Cys-motif partner protein
MGKDINSKPYDEATLTKLDIFERYLQAWLPVFVQSQYATSAAIWDFFAGSGQDSEGVPGSPLRILQQIDSFRGQIIQKNMPIRILLNEERKRKSAELANLVEQSRASWSLGGLVTVDCQNEDFQVLFRSRYEELKRQPNLIFIDQYGIKHVTEEVFRMLIALPKTDFLFFISSSAMKRFATTPEFTAIFPDFSADNVANARVEDVHRIMLDHYQGMVPSSNRTRLYPFTLRKGGNVYGLVFGSAHPLGVEKFLDLAWNQNGLNGEANFDIDDDRSKAQPVLFQEMRRLTKREVFEADLERFIRDAGETTNCRIYEFTMEKGHPKAHARECVSRLRREKKVEYTGHIGFSYRSCFGGEARTVTVRAVTDG